MRQLAHSVGDDIDIDAPIEARRAGAHMYGAAHYVVIDQVAKLPQKLPDIYRKLMA